MGKAARQPGQVTGFPHKIVLVLLLVAGLPYSAKASEPLTWDACLKIARENNPDLLSSEKNLAARQADRKRSTNGFLPRLSVSQAYVTEESPTPSKWTTNGTASMDLFNQSRAADISAARAAVNQAGANLDLTSANVLFNLHSAFAALLYAEDQAEVAARIQEIRQKDADLISLRYKSGRESKGNKMRADAQFLQAKLDVEQAQRDLSAAREEFAHQLGVPVTGDLAVSGPAASAPLEEPGKIPSFIDSHPSVALQNAAVASAQAALKQSKSVLWPSLSANYVQSFQSDRYALENPSWSASGVISYPIFGGGPTAAYYSVSASKRDLEKAEESLVSTRNQVRSDLESAWSNLAGARDQVTVQSAFLEAARQRNGEADIRYANGLMSYENWEAIVTDRVNFERGLVRAKQDSMTAEAQWDKALGKGLGTAQ